MQNVAVLQSLGSFGGTLLREDSLKFKCLCVFQGSDVYLPIAGCFWRNKIIVHQE